MIISAFISRGGQGVTDLTPRLNIVDSEGNKLVENSEMTSIPNTTGWYNFDFNFEEGITYFINGDAGIDNVDNRYFTETVHFDAEDAEDILSNMMELPDAGPMPTKVSLTQAILYLYKVMRNKKSNSGNRTAIFNNEGTDIDHWAKTEEKQGIVIQEAFANGEDTFGDDDD